MFVSQLLKQERHFLIVVLPSLLQIVMDADSGAPTEELATQTKEFCGSLGIKVTRSSEIAPAVPEALDQAIKAGIGRANANAVSNATKVNNQGDFISMRRK